MIAKDKGRDPRIPDKQNFRIGEVADIAEVESYVLRFWETEFKCLRPSKSKSNQRMYSHEDVELVLQIRDLLYEEGFTIAGARRRLRAADRDAGEELTRARDVLRRVQDEVEDLLKLVEE
jgi:DNA-binding transcriptional MerR regulator